MKKLTTFSLLVFIMSFCWGQDTISTKDKKVLNVRVIEQTDKLIKYQLSDFQDGPVFTINASQIASIKYRNGYIDLAGNQNPRKYRPVGISGGLALE